MPSDALIAALAGELRRLRLVADIDRVGPGRVCVRGPILRVVADAERLRAALARVDDEAPYQDAWIALCLAAKEDADHAPAPSRPLR